MVRWNVEFIDILANQEGLTGGVYDHTIVRMIALLEEDCVSSGGNRRPVLATFNNSNNNIRWFDIHFHRNPSTRVTVRFRRDDLYVYGYQVNDQQWLEFGYRGGPHLIDRNSDHVGFLGTYRELANAGGSISNQTLGQEALISAVDVLATSTARRERAQALRLMILMFSEAARFIPVRSYIQRVFYMAGGVCTVPDWVDKLIHRWGKLSGYILYYIAHPNEEWVAQTITIEAPGTGEHRVTVDVVARTAGDMLLYIGILEKNPAKIQPAPRN